MRDDKNKEKIQWNKKEISAKTTVSMFCWKCKKKLDLPDKKVGFHAVCEFCDADLHVCKNCKYYAPGKPNSCSVPNSLHISEREKFNFCEDFCPKEEKTEEQTTSSEEVSERLFGEKPPKRKRDFRSLFPDD